MKSLFWLDIYLDELNFHLKNVTVEIPQGVMVGIAGVSGSGKTSLISGTLVPLLKQCFNTEESDDDQDENKQDIAVTGGTVSGKLTGWERIQKCIVVNQAPIGRSKSGGEAQRIKLGKELGSTNKNGVLYILDEPTTGLGYSDTARLMELLDELVNQGNSIIITEHDSAVLSCCDWIFELGPEGGDNGGEIITKGSPTQLKTDPKSKIGQFLLI